GAHVDRQRGGFLGGRYIRIRIRTVSRNLFTAEALRAQSREFLIKEYSDLCELRVSVVKIDLEEFKNDNSW
ncbi:MAG TPA: hypothetical protein VFW91_19665, partial [Candidatus Binatia bacterium]|nr:hypothetical protein [Candidatus Binatia bacterium]